MYTYPRMTRIAACLVLIAFLFIPPAAADPLAVPLSVRLADGLITGPGLNKPIPVSQTTGIFETAAGGALNLRPDAPLGHYTVIWKLDSPLKSAALTVTAITFATDVNQPNRFMLRQGKTFYAVVCGSSKFWTPQTISGVAWPIDSSPKALPIVLEWSFNKPVSGGSQIVHLSSLTIAAADAAKARRDFMTPLAEGLPPPADPATSLKPWTQTLQIKRGVIYKGSQPFFPIGFTAPLDERFLAEQKAMGCNAIHTEVGWSSAPGPGPVPAAAYDGTVAAYQRAGQWGFVVCPLLTGHYVPSWFYAKNSGAPPMGSDGKPSGGWFPFSTHYPPFLENIPDFWRGVAPVLARQPNVLTLNLWNEPGYGGGWLTPNQFADYSEWGITDYRTYLRQKYSTLAALNAAHQQQYASFDTLEPPHTPQEMGPAAWLEWLEYGDNYFAQFFQKERDIIKAVAPQARLANKKETQMWGGESAASANNWFLLNQSEDVSGVNLYISSETGERDILEGARSYAPGKPIIIYETNVMPPGAASRTPDRIRTQLWSQILGGANGMFIYALINDNDHGLLSDAAVPKESRGEYVTFIRNAAHLQRELASPFAPAKIGVLYSRTATLATPGLTMPSSAMSTFDLVRNAHFAADFLPEERCTADGLKAYQVVVIPSHTILKKPQLDALAEWVQRGGKVLSFGHALATDETLNPIAAPVWLELGSRAPALDGRSSQMMARAADPLLPYDLAQIPLTDIELIAQATPTDDTQPLVPGRAIKTNQKKSQVLGWSADSYPVIVRSRSGNVIYCAFDSRYSSDLSALIGGILKLYLGQRQEVALLGSDDLPVPSVLESLRQDPQDPSRRYLMAVNVSYHPAVVRITSQDGWRVTQEKIMGLPIGPGKAPEVRLAARHAYLFELQRTDKLKPALPHQMPAHK